MSFRWIGLSLVLALMFTLGGIGCKQGQGERCQIDNDCEDGLVCNASEEVCQQEGVDTTPDASTTDSAPPIDAMPPNDGAVDASPDANVTDAMVNDAVVTDA